MIPLPEPLLFELSQGWLVEMAEEGEALLSS